MPSAMSVSMFAVRPRTDRRALQERPPRVELHGRGEREGRPARPPLLHPAHRDHHRGRWRAARPRAAASTTRARGGERPPRPRRRARARHSRGPGRRAAGLERRCVVPQPDQRLARAKFTEASTPGCLFRVFSTRTAHDPQVMPSTSRRSSRSVVSGSVVLVFTPRSLPAEPRHRREELLDLLVALALIHAVLRAVPHVLVEEPHADGLRGGRHGVQPR